MGIFVFGKCGELPEICKKIISLRKKAFNPGKKPDFFLTAKTTSFYKSYLNSLTGTWKRGRSKFVEFITIFR